MRVLFVVPYIPSLIRVRPYHFLRQLALRHEVYVLAAGPSAELAHAEQLREFCREVLVVPLSRRESAASCAAAAMRGEPLQAAYCRSTRFAARLGSLLAAREYDVVHVEHLRAAHVRSLLPPGLPTVYDSVDCISLLLERTLESSHSLRQRVIAAVELRRTRCFEGALLGQFDRVAVTSPEDREALLGLAPAAAVSVVANGVDLEYFRPLAVAHEPARLVFSGKMSYHANATAAIHFVREILPRVRVARPDVQVLIVGSNPPREVLALAKDQAVRVTGYLPDIREALGSATVAVCPVTVKVGIQNKVLEAMALGLPVVSTRQGVRGLAVEGGRDLLVADSDAQFAGHICRLLADRPWREAMGQRGREYVEQNHRWDTAARQLEVLYGEAIALHRSGKASQQMGA